MENKNFLDQIINWEIDDLSLLIHLAIKLLYSDGIDSIEEWNVINLLPALIEMIQSTCEQKEAENWKIKLKKVESILQEKDTNKEILPSTISSTFSDINKQKAVIYFLLYLALADKKLDPKEAAFFNEFILRPFNWTNEDLTGFVDQHSGEFINPSILKDKIKKLFKGTSKNSL